MIKDLWYKNSVVYCLHVGTFMDTNGDGVGDFAGLMRRLDYLAGLGVTCLWLLPFQASPRRDDGYDIADYYTVDPCYGTLGDFVEFTHAAKQRGIRVIIDLVVNHTSDKHAWFLDARRDRRSKCVRTPMQWSTEPQGGFSTAKKTVLPVITGGPYGYEKVNAAAQRRDLTFTRAPFGASDVRAAPRMPGVQCGSETHLAGNHRSPRLWLGDSCTRGPRCPAARARCAHRGGAGGPTGRGSVSLAREGR